MVPKSRRETLVCPFVSMQTRGMGIFRAGAPLLVIAFASFSCTSSNSNVSIAPCCNVGDAGLLKPGGCNCEFSDPDAGIAVTIDDQTDGTCSFTVKQQLSNGVGASFTASSGARVPSCPK